jgi:hypothetical protein
MVRVTLQFFIRMGTQENEHTKTTAQPELALAIRHLITFLTGTWQF